MPESAVLAPEQAFRTAGLTLTPAAILSVATDLPPERLTSASWPSSWASPRSGSSVVPGFASAAAPALTSASATTPRAPGHVPWRPRGWMRRILIS